MGRPILTRAVREGSRKRSQSAGPEDRPANGRKGSHGTTADALIVMTKKLGAGI